MKINLIDKCKANHTVTVPREYIEELESFYKNHVEKHHNLSGKVMNVRVPYSNERHLNLFITDDGLGLSEIDGIVIVDTEGREVKRF